MHNMSDIIEQYIKHLFEETNEDVVEILNIPLGSSQVEDKVVWHFDKRGMFTVNSGYNLGAVLNDNPSASNNSTMGRWWKVP